MGVATGFEILPAIDLRGGRVVRLQQGDFERETRYPGDPVVVAERFVAAGTRWLHVVDLDGARSGTAEHGPVIARIVAAVGDRIAVEVAGGLRDPASVAAVLASGARRVVVGTAALEDPEFVADIISTHGSAQVAVAIDVRDGYAIGHGWMAGTAGTDATEAIGRLVDAGVVTFEVTAIERDGLLDGPDLELYERLARHVGPGAIIASGGIATLEDLHALRDVGCTGAIVGRALYDGRLDLAEAILTLTSAV